MNISSERDLRAQLGAALDLLEPSPLPLDAVVRRGATVVIARKTLAVVVLILLTTAALTGPKLVEHLLHPAPAAPPRYHVTVSPPGHGASKHLIASGTLNRTRWTATGAHTRQGFGVCWRISGRPGDFCNGDDFPGPAFPGLPAVPYYDWGRNPDVVFMVVRADVRYLQVGLSNGQSVTLRPVPAFGKAGPRLVAIAVPSYAALVQISAYSATGDLGYTVPVSPSNYFGSVAWLKPDQPARPRPATYTIASGQVHGQPWTEKLHVGPWGYCLVDTFGGDTFDITWNCFPVSVDQPLLKPTQVWDDGYSNSNVSFDVIVGPRKLSYVISRVGNGSPVLVRSYRVGASRYVVLVGKDSVVTHWIAYSADGQRLGSGSS